LQLKDNVLQRGLAPLEEPFDQNYVAKRPELEPVGVEQCNIGTTEHPKMIKLSKTLSPKMKKKILGIVD